MPAILLLAVTVLFWGIYDRYELDGEILLESPTLADARQVRGDCQETNGCFRLSVPEGGRSASINFRLARTTPYRMVRVRGRIRTEGVVEGKYPWSCARLMLSQYDPSNQWIPGKHGLVMASGSEKWASHEDIFPILPGAAHVDVVIQNGGSFGTAEFDSLVAEPVTLRTSFFWWQGVFAFLWIGMAALYYRRTRLHRRKLRMLILLNALAILFGTMMPSVWMETLSDGAVETLGKTIERRKAKSPPAVAPSGAPATKPAAAAGREKNRVDQFNKRVGGIHRAGHFALFASLCFLVYLSAALERQHPSYYLKVAFDILLFAAITESLQNLTLDRTAGLSDLRNDLYGMLTAFVLFLLVRLFLRLNDPKNEKAPLEGGA
ncbi:VanZ family protein [Pontiella sp.]|uniref:VanZ family protein n=1 Tax=Pontiella sp. TaxID=2837462 RepID=UPI00356335C0